MSRNERRLREMSDIPEASFIDMGKIQQNAQAIAGTNQFSSSRSQTWPPIGSMRKLKWNSMPKCIGTAPDNAKRTQPCLEKHLKSIKVRINRFSPLKVKNDRQNARLEAMYQLVNGPHDFDLSPRLSLKSKETSSHRHGPALSEARING